MRASRIRLALVLLAVILGAGSVSAQPTNKAQRATINRFAANNSLFVLYHEIGHMLVHQLNLPVLGREEDAADNIATWTLLRRGTPTADQTLEDAAYGWLLSGMAYNDIQDEDLYGNHSLDRQRAFQIVCLMVGSNESAFAPIANEYAIDTDRQGSCADDYYTVNRSLEGLLGARGSKKGHGTKVSVTYHDAGGDLKRAAEAFRASGVFEQVADEVRKKYSISKPLQFNAERCGEANAFYDPDNDEIIFCYELMQDYIDLYSADIPASDVEVPPRVTGSGKSKNLPPSTGTNVSQKN